MANKYTIFYSGFYGWYRYGEFTNKKKAMKEFNRVVRDEIKDGDDTKWIMERRTTTRIRHHKGTPRKEESR